MNDEKKIAQAILDAQEMREESYVTEGGEAVSLSGVMGEYKLTIEECLIATCKKHGLSENLWYLLSLAMHWWNDIQLWAEDVLASKNISEECQKENAKMKDGIKQVEKSSGNKFSHPAWGGKGTADDWDKLQKQSKEVNDNGLEKDT